MLHLVSLCDFQLLAKLLDCVADRRCRVVLQMAWHLYALHVSSRASHGWTSTPGSCLTSDCWEDLLLPQLVSHRGCIGSCRSLFGGGTNERHDLAGILLQWLQPGLLASQHPWRLPSAHQVPGALAVPFVRYATCTSHKPLCRRTSPCQGGFLSAVCARRRLGSSTPSELPEEPLSPIKSKSVPRNLPYVENAQRFDCKHSKLWVHSPW